jgi:hypothetical protein
MNTIPLSEWRTAYASALFEPECGPWQARVKEALEKINERVRTLPQHETIERMSIEAARKSLAVLKCKPVSSNPPKSKPEVKKVVPEVGSRIRVELLPAEVVEAEVVAIFTAATRKPYLISFGSKFARVDLQQIVEPR